jgi:hypothetical protein
LTLVSWITGRAGTSSVASFARRSTRA